MRTGFYRGWLARQVKPSASVSQRGGYSLHSLAAMLFLGGLLAVDNLTPHHKAPPPEGIWKILSEMTWPEPANAADVDFAKPRFSGRIRALNGKAVTIGGYLVPTDLHGSAGTLILSAYPVQSCFFCGGAGPESVVEVYPAKKANYLMKKLTFRGTLVLNESDPQHMIYQLKNAERIFEDE